MAVKSYTLAGGAIRWRYAFDLPRGASGKRIQKIEKGFLSAEAASEAEAKARKQHGARTPAADGSVSAELDKWCDEREIDLDPESVAHYRTMFKNYVKPYIGEMPLHRVNKDVINKLYRTLLKSGRQNGTGLARDTVNSAHKSLSSAFKGLGVDMAGVRIPPKKKQRGRRGVWDSENCVEFLRLAVDERLYVAFVLAIVCGMRRGELAGLRWRAIDLDRGVLRVEKQRTTSESEEHEGGVVEKAPKGTSERSIPLGSLLVPLLRQFRQVWETERAEAGDRWQGEDFLFVVNRGKARGRPYYPGYFANRFNQICDRYKLPRICLHDTRHSSASIGSAVVGVDIKTLQTRLGHADPKTLISIYLHQLSEGDRVASEGMERLLLAA